MDCIKMVVTMNPCPCGWRGHPTHPCTCSPSAIERYINRVSGPVLDRIDLHIQVHPVDYQALSTSGGETSAQILQRVIKGRQYQLNRQAITGVECNADLPPAAMEKVCTLTPQAEQVLKSAFEKLGFSARGRDKILKVARTIADLSDSDVIQAAHMHEAIAYRSLDRSMF